MNAPSTLASTDDVKIPSIFLTVFVLAVVIKLTFHAWKSNHSAATVDDVRDPDFEQDDDVDTFENEEEESVPMRPRAALVEDQHEVHGPTQTETASPATGSTASSSQVSEPVLLQSRPPTPTHVFDRSDSIDHAAYVFDHAFEKRPRQRMSPADTKVQEPESTVRSPPPPRGPPSAETTGERGYVRVEDRFRETQGGF